MRRWVVDRNAAVLDQFQHQAIDIAGFFEPDAVVAAGDSADIPASPTSGSYNVSEAYAELRAPLVAGMPGAQLIDLNAAGRISKLKLMALLAAVAAVAISGAGLFLRACSNETAMGLSPGSTLRAVARFGYAYPRL